MDITQTNSHVEKSATACLSRMKNILLQRQNKNNFSVKSNIQLLLFCEGVMTKENGIDIINHVANLNGMQNEKC